MLSEFSFCLGKRVAGVMMMYPNLMCNLIENKSNVS